MSSQVASSSPAAEKVSKTRLPILDGLRGVAALLVVAFHIFDGDLSFDTVSRPMNHGYLAVDFFYMLSGFVMGYAYDDRMGSMSLVSFFKRRLVRLHPMVVIGSIIGAIFFYFGVSEMFPNVAKTGFGMLLAATALGAMLIPTPASLEVRGWEESYPLNGPAWSLLFEYIANVAYALFIRRFPPVVLGGLAVVFGGVLAYLIIGSGEGTVNFGWLMTVDHQLKGLVRVAFPFITGLFLFRFGKTIRVKHAFILASVALLVALPLPRIGAMTTPWVNGVYECLVLVVLMPLVVLIGAGGRSQSATGDKFCEFLGDLSYPLYLVHYPMMYVYYAWLKNTAPALDKKIPVAIGVYVASIVLGYVVMRFVDTPVRRRLARFAR
jgi:peptidoglycan/LPS O-acetylase OafA/YrhL